MSCSKLIPFLWLVGISAKHELSSSYKPWKKKAQPTGCLVKRQFKLLANELAFPSMAGTVCLH